MNAQQTLRPTVVSVYNYVQPMVAVVVSVLTGLGIFKPAHAIADAEKKSAGSIYDTHGRKVADYEGSIDTINLQKGVYVVKTKSGESFKMLKK